MSDEEQVVWPEDPIEADTRAAEAEPEPTVQPQVATPSWPATFDEALKQSQASSDEATPAASTHTAAGSNDENPTQPSMPAISAKTQPPAGASEAAKTVPPVSRTSPSLAALGEADENPTSTFKAQAPMPVAAVENHEPEPQHEPVQAQSADTTMVMAPAKREPAAEPETELEAEHGAGAAQEEAASAPQPVVTPEPEPVTAAEPLVAAADETETVAAEEPETVMAAEPEPVGAAEGEAAEAAEPEPVTAAESEPVTAAEPDAVKAAEPEPKPAEDEWTPAPVKPAEPEPVKAAEPEPVKAAEPEPQPKEDEWIPAPVNPPVPSWAPKVGAQQPAEQQVSWPGSNLPSWAPVGGARPTQNVPAAASSTPRPSIPIGEALPPSRPPTPTPAPAPAQPQPRASNPPAAPGADTKSKTSSSWEIVQQKPEVAKPAYVGPNPEDKSYAEWFAWAKRSGAPASACHAAAQGAFRALAAGQDMNTAVQWATLAMASPPGLVGASRQLYCAWYSLGNIDLKLPTPQAHAFATGAVKALDEGQDAPTAHQSGLAAAGITG